MSNPGTVRRCPKRGACLPPYAKRPKRTVRINYRARESQGQPTPEPRFYFITRKRALISRAGKTQAQCRSYHLSDRPEIALPRLSSSRLPPKVREAFSSAKPHWGPTHVSKRRSVKYSKVAAARWWRWGGSV